LHCCGKVDWSKKWTWRPRFKPIKLTKNGWGKTNSRRSPLLLSWTKP
jgi:hypothetical protein